MNLSYTKKPSILNRDEYDRLSRRVIESKMANQRIIMIEVSNYFDEVLFLFVDNVVHRVDSISRVVELDRAGSSLDDGLIFEDPESLQRKVTYTINTLFTTHSYHHLPCICLILFLKTPNIPLIHICSGSLY